MFWKSGRCIRSYYKVYVVGDLKMIIVLTHDIDSIRKPFKHIWQRRNRFTIKDIILSALNLKNLYNNIEDVIALEDKYGVKSTLFVPVFLFNINEIIDTLRSIKRQGWEVQLHYVYEANQAVGLFRMQKEYFEEEIGIVEGVRVHKLIMNDVILNMLQKEGIKYDSTLRVETANTYNPYYITKEMIEIPIAIMDADLFGRLQLNEDQALKYIDWKLKSAQERGAWCFTILFHQESYRMKGGRIYSKVLELIKDKEVMTCNQLVNHVKLKSARQEEQKNASSH